MSRRTAALLTAVAMALTSCSANDGGHPAASPSAGTPPTARQQLASSAPPEPAASEAPDQALPVRVRKLKLSRGKDRPLPTTIWYPATGDGPYPVIVFSHGLTSRPEDYASLLRRWARAGFVVAGAAYPHTSRGAADFTVLDLINQPADASYVLTEVLALNRKRGDPLENRLDEEHVAAAGHSGGGVTTLGMLSGNRDKRLTAAVVLAGRQLLPAAFQGPPLPVLFVHGKLDKTVQYADGLAAFNAVPRPKALLTLPQGGHVTTSGPDFARVTTTTTDFLRWSLYGDASARRRLAATNNLRDNL
ncbi:chlorophyllase [Couchioplanes caeruleus]|uniref:alpha/beta hydrolase family protein n=1 Tax=Couchioplanes caeruleus TaxID=56438 RepID=UPI0020BD6770|nr:chlorophyllase [Couchioplanes caeruleus]UQU65965.1 chlorophyllase [Couchioplanes caeruleus]